jgi:ABC-type nitrate/sulfonate/bicarbonate transport system permease component
VVPQHSSHYFTVSCSDTGIPVGTFAAGLELDCKQWLAVCGLLIVAAALGVGVGVPLALELRSSRLLEARLQVVRRILKEVPLVDG